MKRFASSAAILSAAISLSGAAQALDIKDYFKMASGDQARFGQMLLDSGEKLLRDQGRSDLAMQLDKFFTEIGPGNQISEGTAEYTLNLSDSRTTQPLFDTARYTQNLESTHRAMQDRRRAGLPADHITVQL